jgi:signal peptidase
VPDLGDYIHAVANIILPFVIYVVTNNSLRYYEKDKKQLRSINYRIITIPVLVIGIVLTILVSGIFSLQLIAVGSDSMRPVFSRGDAVLFEKVSASEIAKDDILVFRREGVIVTHRVVSIESRSGMLYFTTRGDANDSNDNFETSSEQVLGRVIMAGKYIGYPTVWLNEIFNQG